MDFDKIKCTAHLVSCTFWKYASVPFTFFTGRMPIFCVRKAYKSWRKMYAILAKHGYVDKKLADIDAKWTNILEEWGIQV